MYTWLLSVSWNFWSSVDCSCWLLAQNWTIPWQNGNLLPGSPETNHSFSGNWQDSCLSSEYLTALFPVLSAHLFISVSHAQLHSSIGSTAPVGRPSASLEFLHSLSFSTRSVQDTIPESVLSSCGCFLTLTLTTSIGIWHSAGATKSWLHSPGRSKSFAVIKNSLNSTEILCLDEKRNAQRWQSNTNWRRKKDMMMRERVWCHEILIPFYAIVLFLSIFFDFSSNALKNLPVTLFLCAKVDFGCARFVVRKLKNSSTKGQSPSQNWSVARNNHPLLANGTDSALSSHYSLWLLDILPDHLSLGSTAPFGRPSASFENSFILSLLLTTPAVSLSVLSKTQLQKAFSLHVGALSHWHSPAQ